MEPDDNDSNYDDDDDDDDDADGKLWCTMKTVASFDIFNKLLKHLFFFKVAYSQ